MSVEERQCWAMRIARGELSYQRCREWSLAPGPVAPPVTGSQVGDDPAEVGVCGYRVHVVDLVGEGMVSVYASRYELTAEVACPRQGRLAFVDQVYPGLA